MEIETDQDMTGWGECCGPVRTNAGVVHELGGLLIRQDALHNEFIWHDLYVRFRDHGQKGSILQGLSGIEIALWDLKGKYLGQPMHRLMGGAMRGKTSPTQTGFIVAKMVIRRTTFADEAADYCAQGTDAVKLKVGFGIEGDVCAGQAVRAVIGDRTRLMIDAKCAKY
jgi:D-galactarolactone cycloisomerase